MDNLPIQIGVGIGFILVFALVLQPLSVHALFLLLQSTVHRPDTDGHIRLVLFAALLLLLPLLVPSALTLVRLLLAMNAITNIQKLISYKKERMGTSQPDLDRQEYLDFMNGYTTNFRDRPAPLTGEDVVPRPRSLRMRAAAKFAIPLIAGGMNVSLSLWQYTPLLLATFVKMLLFFVVLSAMQDLIRAGLIRKRRRPDVVLMDWRIFRSQSFAEGIARVNPTTHRWLLRTVYIPLGHHAHPVRNSMACYLVSGLWHEYILTVASSRITGLWFAYFLVLGVLDCIELTVARQPKHWLRRMGRGSRATKGFKASFAVLYMVIHVCVAQIGMKGVSQIILFH